MCESQNVCPEGIMIKGQFYLFVGISEALQRNSFGDKDVACYQQKFLQHF